MATRGTEQLTYPGQYWLCYDTEALRDLTRPIKARKSFTTYKIDFRAIKPVKMTFYKKRFLHEIWQRKIKAEKWP